MSSPRYALVAGGGTGGHLVPALSLARALADGRQPAAVAMVGSRRGLEPQMLSDTGLPVTLLPGRGIVRRMSGRALLSNAGAVAGLAVAFVLAVALVARSRPAVVVAVGGYASVPVGLAAALLRVPIVLVNVDASPGAANRLVGRFAAASAVAFEGTPLPKAVVTGAPVAPEMVAAARPDPAQRRQARQALGLPEDRPVVAVVGGSLGAKRLNDAALELAGLWAGRSDRAVYHVVGRRDFGWAAAAAPSPAALTYRQVEFEDRMASLYQAADVVVCRAGALTVAELAVVGVASVLVPLPGAPGDHQRANADVLAAVGGAEVLDDADCDGKRLAEDLDALLSSPSRLTEMAAAAAAVGRPGGLEAVTALVEAHARRRR